MTTATAAGKKAKPTKKLSTVKKPKTKKSASGGLITKKVASVKKNLGTLVKKKATVKKETAAPKAATPAQKAASTEVTALKKIDWYKKGGGLAEIYQKTGIVYDFATAPDKKGVQKSCHGWVKCRDFLHDAVRTQITGTKSSIYGFNFEKGTNPEIDLKKMRMLVSKNDLPDEAAIVAFKEKMRNAIALLNHFESYAGISLSSMVEVDAKDSGKKYVVLFTGSGMWMSSPFLVSMYTFIIRLGDKSLKFKDKESLQKALKKLSGQNPDGDNDITYLKDCWQKLHTVLDKREVLFTKKDGFHDIFFAGHNIGNFHNRCGIISLTKSITPDSKLNELVKKELS